jgi:hypothetical protein
MALLAALSGDPQPDDAFELEWTADAACPSEADVRMRITAMLLGASTEGLRAWALVRDLGSNFELDLSWELGPWREHRIVRSHDCDELAGLAAMLLASTVDPFGLIPRSPAPEPVSTAPDVLAEPPRPRPKVQLPKPIEPEPEPEFQLHLEAEPEPEPRVPRRPVRGLLLADGLGFVNVLPRPGGGARLGLGIEVANFRMLALASTWFGPGFRSATDPDLGGDLWAWSAELAPCGLPRWRRLEFPLCGQLGAGQIIGRGVGSTDTSPRAQPWLWLGADASLAWWLRPSFALFGGVGLGVSLLRPRFGVAGTDADFTVPLVFGRLHAGVAVRFGRRDSSNTPKPDRRDPDRQASP